MGIILISFNVTMLMWLISTYDDWLQTSNIWMNYNVYYNSCKSNLINSSIGFSFSILLFVIWYSIEIN